MYMCISTVHYVKFLKIEMKCSTTVVLFLFVYTIITYFLLADESAESAEER